MSEKQTSYLQAREALLAHITITLKQDQRFIAAWLAGSYARGEQQWFSDLDLHVVVAEEYSAPLCAQPWSAGAKTTPERLALFTQFGEPAVIYEVHANNLRGGTFTYVLYQESASNVQNFLHGDLVQYQTLLRWLEGNIRETRAALRGERTSFTKASRIKLYCTREEQIATLRSLCDEMESLMPQVIALGGYVPASPRTVIEKRLALLE